MTHKLYLYGSKVSLFTGTEKECRFYASLLLTEAERRTGWTIIPVQTIPAWAHRRVANRLWATAGAGIAAFFFLILFLAMKGHL